MGFDEFSRQKQTVSSLRAQLNKLDSELNSFFKLKNETGQRIVSLINTAKKLRQERNALTDEVKKHKEERKKIHELIRAKIAEVKEINDKRKDVQAKQGLRGNPVAIRKKIDELEYRIETEGMSFEAEQKVMKQIKALKKQAEELAAINSVWEQSSSKNKELAELRAMSEVQHSLVQTKAEESQKKHEEVLALMKEVDALRPEEDKVKKQISETKDKMDLIKKQLEEGLLKLNELGKLAGQTNERKKRDQLESKSLSVEEKLRKGEKLTTEDFLAWQAKKE